MTTCHFIVCADNFHGRTLGIVGFSTDAAAREHIGPSAPGFRIIPFGNAKALEEAIMPNTVAFLVEPIQGEAGVIIPPPGYFTKVRDLVRFMPLTNLHLFNCPNCYLLAESETVNEPVWVSPDKLAVAGFRFVALAA